MIRKLLLLSLLVLLSALVAHAQTPATVTGTITDASGSPATSGYVLFTIQPTAQSVLYYVIGLNTIAPQNTTCGINGSGVLKNVSLSGPCLVWGNDVITPGNTTYRVSIAPANVVSNTINQLLILSAGASLNSPVFAPPVRVVPQYQTITTNPIYMNLTPAVNNVFNVGQAGLQYAAGYFGNIFVSSLANGNCLQAGPNGSITTINSGCGISAGTVTAFSSTASVGTLFVTSVANSTTTPAQTITLQSAAQNLFFASPNGSSGVGSYRAIVAADLPSTITSNTSGNATTATSAGTAGTATALASAPSLCTTGQAPTGVLANGNATGCVATVSSTFIATSGTATLSTTFYGFQAGFGTGDTTELHVSMPAPVAGTVNDLKVRFVTTGGVGTTWTVNLRDNATSEVLTCTTASAGQTCSDLTDSFTVTQGDLLDWQLTASGAPSNSTMFITARWVGQ